MTTTIIQDPIRTHLRERPNDASARRDLSQRELALVPIRRREQREEQEERAQQAEQQAEAGGEGVGRRRRQRTSQLASEGVVDGGVEDAADGNKQAGGEHQELGQTSASL